MAAAAAAARLDIEAASRTLTISRRGRTHARKSCAVAPPIVPPLTPPRLALPRGDRCRQGAPLAAAAAAAWCQTNGAEVVRLLLLLPMTLMKAPVAGETPRRRKRVFPAAAGQHQHRRLETTATTAHADLHCERAPLSSRCPARRCSPHFPVTPTPTSCGGRRPTVRGWRRSLLPEAGGRPTGIGCLPPRKRPGRRVGCTPRRTKWTRS